jgi:hypothetical protein
MTDEKLEKEVGVRDMKILEPAKVKIVQVNLAEVKFGNKINEKVALSCLHPEKEEPIIISKVKIITKGDKIQTSGLWFNQDEDGNIQKGSTLAEFLKFAKVTKPKDLVDMEFETIADDEGFLMLKGY